MTGTAVGELAQRVWKSQAARRRSAPDAACRETEADGEVRPRRRWRYRFRPLGVAFTMARTRAVREESLARLHALAVTCRMSIEAALDEALRLARPLMERRRPRRPSG